MDLGGEVGEVILTSVQVQSNKAESSLVNSAVLADVDAAHEPHVGVEQQGLDTTVWVGSRACALHVGDADEAVEVGQRRWIDTWPKERQMEVDPTQRHDIGRRFGRCR